MNTIEVSEKIFERLDNNMNIVSYWGLLAYYAVVMTSYESNNIELIEKCKTILKKYPNGRKKEYFNFKNYEVGGNAKAWLVYKGLLEEEKENVRKYAELTVDSPKNENGILCWPTDTDKIWIDVITAVTPFMLYAGLALNEEKYIDFAAEQCFLMYETFLDKTCGLLHQCLGFREDKNLMSEDHWSRGNGWAYLGLAVLVENLPDNSKHRKKAEEYFVNLSKSFLKVQNEKGVWRQELTCEHSWDESSGSGLITYGLGVGLRLGLLDRTTFEVPYIKAVEALGKYFINEDFSTNMSCKGCLCPGEGKDKGTVKAYLTEVYPAHDEMHSFGCLMLAMLEAYKNGIKDIKLAKLDHSEHRKNKN